MDHDKQIARIKEPRDLLKIINEAKCDSSECDKNNAAIHNQCIICQSLTDEDGNLVVLDGGNNIDANQQKNTNLLPIPHCQAALIYILIKVISANPKLFDDDAKRDLTNYYKTNNLEARGLVLIEYLSILDTTKSPLLTWIKYEALLIHLIKEQIYAPKTLANEILTVVKNELNPNIAKKFSSVISSCVKHCREANKGKNEEEEEEQKWCEIIDWMSWFMSAGDDDGFS